MRRGPKRPRACSGYDLQSIAIRTQSEVAALLGCSRALVVQIEASAMRKLRVGLGLIGGVR